MYGFWFFLCGQWRAIHKRCPMRDLKITTPASQTKERIPLCFSTQPRVELWFVKEKWFSKNKASHRTQQLWGRGLSALLTKERIFLHVQQTSDCSVPSRESIDPKMRMGWFWKSQLQFLASVIVVYTVIWSWKGMDIKGDPVTYVFPTKEDASRQTLQPHRIGLM